MDIVQNPATGKRMNLKHSWFGALLGGPIFWALHGHTALAVVIVISAGLAWPITAIFARSILLDHYDRRGWVRDGRVARFDVIEQPDGRRRLRVVDSEWDI
jgi:hypothetical protein